MQCIVDTSVHNALTYYSTYLFEPSLAGDVTITGGITQAHPMDFKLVLTTMKSLGSSGELMVVTHSSPEGFMMPLVAGGKVSAQFKVMDKILEIIGGIDAREAIKKLPAKDVPKAWQVWFRKYDPGIKLEDGYETNPDWQTYVEQSYGQWYDRQGSRILGLPNHRTEFPKLIGLVRDVRHAGFKRLELRACDFGTQLATIASFLKTKTVVSPKDGVMTSYYPKQKVKILPGAKYTAEVKRLGARTFVDGDGNKIGFALHVLGNRATELATSEGEIRKFVKKYVKANYKGGVQPLALGGLEPTGARDVFPLEAAYKSHLTMYPGSNTP